MSRRPPAEVDTLGALFDVAADQFPDQRVHTFFAEDSVTFKALAAAGRGGAGHLVAAGVHLGEPVAVLVRSPLAVLRMVHATAAAGAAFMPLPAPVAAVDGAYLARLGRIVADSGVRFVVVDDDLAPAFAAALPTVATMALSSLAGPDPTPTLPAVTLDDLAFVQYTSGSTSTPKGVALTHGNVLAGIRTISDAIDTRPDDVLCHWLPLSHNMGVFATLAAVAVGAQIAVSPPADFLKHPDRWLRRFCALRATVMVGPNFSYHYLLDAVDAEDAADLDLSAVRVMLNGSEPVDPTVGARLAERFAASGLAPTAITPCYGLAEATLLVSTVPPDSAPGVDWVDRESLNQAGQARPARPGADGARAVVDCGPPVSGMQVRITDGGRSLPERTVGHIEIRGAAVMRGYHHESEPTLDADGWCPTGDLGYLADSRLYVTGRAKEMLIIGGKNHYPQDVENAVRPLVGIHQGHVAAVVLPADPSARTAERLVVLAEVALPPAGYPEIVSAIRRAAAAELGGASVGVVLVAPGGLARTTSGKYQRLLMRDQLLRGALPHVLADPDRASCPT